MSVALEAKVCKLEGERLISVNFLEQYLQLDFGEPLLNIYTPITIAAFGATTRTDDDGFRDALCGRIAKRVDKVSLVPNDALTIAFDDGAKISISLRPDDYSGPEAIEARGLAEQWLSI